MSVLLQRLVWLICVSLVMVSGIHRKQVLGTRYGRNPVFHRQHWRDQRLPRFAARIMDEMEMTGGDGEGDQLGNPQTFFADYKKLWSDAGISFYFLAQGTEGNYEALSFKKDEFEKEFGIYPPESYIICSIGSSSTQAFLRNTEGKVIPLKLSEAAANFGAKDKKTKTPFLREQKARELVNALQVAVAEAKTNPGVILVNAIGYGVVGQNRYSKLLPIGAPFPEYSVDEEGKRDWARYWLYLLDKVGKEMGLSMRGKPRIKGKEIKISWARYMLSTDFKDNPKIKGVIDIGGGPSMTLIERGPEGEEDGGKEIKIKAKDDVNDVFKNNKEPKAIFDELQSRMVQLLKTMVYKKKFKKEIKDESKPKNPTENDLNAIDLETSGIKLSDYAVFQTGGMRKAYCEQQKDCYQGSQKQPSPDKEAAPDSQPPPDKAQSKDKSPPVEKEAVLPVGNQEKAPQPQSIQI